MLHLKKVLGAKPKEHVVSELETLYTPWGEKLDIDHVLDEHPTPQFARENFQMLNGKWDCAFVEKDAGLPDDPLQAAIKAEAPADFDKTIVVPFSPEAPLSGVNRQLQPSELLWYRRSFRIDKPKDDERIILHFQAVDYACAVRLNGQLIGSHRSGYIPFFFDITDVLTEGENTIEVCVSDPSEHGAWLRGKQRFDRGDIWYTAQSGIWQGVWLERVPRSHVESIVIEPDAVEGILAVGLNVKIADENSDQQVRIDVYDGDSSDGEPIAFADCKVESRCAVALRIPDVRLWSPSDPHLYRLRIKFGSDVVDSYCGFRTVECKEDAQGKKRVFLNGEPIFIKGVLDQAYWSDGLMTAPSDEALVFDIEAMRDAGFNLMRKHIKVERERWYYHCDRLGMLVLQDMVSGGGAEIQTWHWSYKPTLFKFSWNHYRDDRPKHWENLGAGDEEYREEWTATCLETVSLLGNHPCIIGWSLFNEGWGQFEARKACELVRKADPSRVIDAVSGWFDQGCGDFSSVHNYFRDMKVWPDRKAKRAFFVSEFGGFTHRVDGHSSLEEAYGYEPYDDRGEWQKAVRDSLVEMDALEPRGLCGYIYTQVSDIEEETNGILTYDRRVNKLED